MIEYLPGGKKVAFDPLNEHYSNLFMNYRTPSTQYIHDKADVTNVTDGFDLAICHNVIDHTDDPAWWFDTLFTKLKLGGDFIFQVNLSRKGVPQPEEHARMHPSPFASAQIMSWLRSKSDSFEHSESEEMSTDGEYYFLAWGKKTHDVPITYVNEVR